MAAETPSRPVAPAGINHLVLNVRDIEASHKFWTEILGFTQVGTVRRQPEGEPRIEMRFYSGDHGGALNHHDVALVENLDLPEPPADWKMFGMPHAINHIAITLPNREAWQQQLKFLQAKGVPFHRRTNHGMTHSVYISDPNGYGIELLYELPREMWEGDIQAALNYAERLPTEGEAALVDDLEHSPSFGQAQAAE